MIQRSSGGAGPPAPIENATAKLAPPGLAAAVVSTGGASEIVTSGLADVRTLRPVSAQLIASCAGQPFCEFVRSELLEPLGMSRTGFEHARAPADVATGYWRLPPGGRAALRPMLPPGIVGQRTRDLVSFRPFYVNGPPYGGLVGDVHDAARFLALHLGCGAAFGQRLLSAESAIAMRTLTTKGRRLTTGLGWWRRHESGDAGGLVEHLGGGGAYRNLMRLYPARGQAVVMFGNLTRYPVEALAGTVSSRAN